MEQVNLIINKITDLSACSGLPQDEPDNKLLIDELSSSPQMVQATRTLVSSMET